MTGAAPPLLAHAAATAATAVAFYAATAENVPCWLSYDATGGAYFTGAARGGWRYEAVGGTCTVAAAATGETNCDTPTLLTYLADGIDNAAAAAAAGGSLTDTTRNLLERFLAKKRTE